MEGAKVSFLNHKTNKMKVVLTIEPESQAELKSLSELLAGLSSLTGSPSTQVVSTQTSSSNKTNAAPSVTPPPVAKVAPKPAPAPTTTVTPPVVEESEEEAPKLTLDSLKQRIAEKAKAGHRDAIRTKLDQMGATSASAVKPEQFDELWNFLNTLK